MSSNDSVRGITTGRVSIGGSLCIGLSAGPLVNSWLLQYVSGGTACYLQGQSTMAIGYILGTIPIAIGGPTDVYVNNGDGVTTVIQFIKTLSGLTAY